MMEFPVPTGASGGVAGFPENPAGGLDVPLEPSRTLTHMTSRQDITETGGGRKGTHDSIRGARPLPAPRTDFGPAGTNNLLCHPDRLLLSVAEAAKLIGISRAFGYKLVMSGVIPSVLIGKLRRIRSSDLWDYVDGLPFSPECRMPDNAARGLPAKRPRLPV